KNCDNFAGILGNSEIIREIPRNVEEFLEISGNSEGIPGTPANVSAKSKGKHLGNYGVQARGITRIIREFLGIPGISVELREITGDFQEFRGIPKELRGITGDFQEFWGIPKEPSRIPRDFLGIPRLLGKLQGMSKNSWEF